MMECYQCKKEVHSWNDATILHAIAWNEPLFILLKQAKCLRCSPSRSQHIIHPQFEPVVDDRPEFDKRLWNDPEGRTYKEHGPTFIEECTMRYTGAWVVMQEKYKDENPIFEERPKKKEDDKRSNN
jgi:hypothetical protein